MQPNSQQAYDRGVSIFSPDGRVYQVEYARESVQRGTPSVGIRTDGGIVLAAYKRLRSPLVEARSVEKLHQLDDHVGVASAGHVADARRLVDLARRVAQTERLRYGEAATVEAIVTDIAAHIQEHTQSGGVRPYGAALLVGGVNPDRLDGDSARIFETDPSGASYEWKATAIGSEADEVTERFESSYSPNLTIEDAIALCLDGLASTADEPLAPESLEVVTIDDRGYQELGEEAVESAIAALDSDDGGQQSNDG